jgi:hypothetical protein
MEARMRSLPGFSALLAALATIFLAEDTAAESPEVPPLQLEAKIPLGDVRGRIDHMAIDLARHRLFVAALGSDSLAVVDLEAQRSTASLAICANHRAWAMIRLRIYSMWRMPAMAR